MMTEKKSERALLQRLLGSKPKKITAAALSAAAVAGIVAGALYIDSRHTPEDIDWDVEQPEQVGYGDAAAAAPISTDTSAGVEDIYDEHEVSFGGNVSAARSAELGEWAGHVLAVEDECLTSWATEQLGALATAGTFETITVCDRPTVVVAGPAGINTGNLVYAAAEDGAPAGAAEVLLDSDTNRFAFTAVRSAGGEAVLLAAAELPAVEEIVWDGTQEEDVDLTK